MRDVPQWKGFAPVLMALALGACGQEQTPQSPPASASTTVQGAGAAIGEAAAREAQQIFASRCATCHGPQGGGDGPASAGLTPPPRDFGDPAWQAAVSDEHIERIVMYGGAAVGRSPAMPANPDLSSKPEVVAALRQYIRNLGKGRP